MNERAMQDRSSLITSALDALLRREDGVTAIEYGLLASLIAVAILVGLTATGDGIVAMYNRWSAAVIAALT
jgi:pilus assembly protein Flp/PilA